MKKKLMTLVNQILRAKTAIVLFLLLAASSSMLVKAQVTPSNAPGTAQIVLIAQPASDSVVLRWAPSTPGGWIIANQAGYMVERFLLEEGKEIDDSGYQKLISSPIKPFELEQWKNYAGAENRFSAIAAQAVYGKTFLPTSPGEGNVSTLKNAADELTNRYSFSLFAADNDAVTATALGLRFVDKKVTPGARYAYRVYVPGETQGYVFDTAYVLIAATNYQKAAEPKGFRYVAGDGNIKLEWDEDAVNPFSGYYIYRSDDDGKSFVKLNDMPLVHVRNNVDAPDAKPFFVDSVTVNYKKYRYMIAGVTPFGDVSRPAELNAYSKDLTPPPSPIIDKPKQVANDRVKITWKLNNPPSDLKGYMVSRSFSSDNGFVFLNQEPLSKQTFQYEDVISGVTEAYYSVAAVDTAGNLQFSPTVMAVIVDTIPPSVPNNLTGVIDSTGKVTLKWDLGPEPNIIGYRVLRANDASHEFIQLTGQIHPDTVFIDSINIRTLTRYVFYRVAAVNNRYQHSDMSPMLRLKRPDLLPPGEAVFYNVFVTDSSVALQWHCSASDDVAKQQIYRKAENEANWNLLSNLAPGVNSYVDRKVQKLVKYSYTLTSTDSTGLVSAQALPVTAKPYDIGKRKGVDNLKATYNSARKMVELTWNYKPDNKEKYWFVVYKSIAGGSYKEYKSVPFDQITFSDTMPSKGQCGYGIVVMTTMGGESTMVTVPVVVE